jgi:hypothetical protein
MNNKTTSFSYVVSLILPSWLNLFRKILTGEFVSKPGWCEPSVRWNKFLEKPVKKPGFSINSKEVVPKAEILEQPR